MTRDPSNKDRQALIILLESNIRRSNRNSIIITILGLGLVVIGIIRVRQILLPLPVPAEAIVIPESHISLMWAVLGASIILCGIALTVLWVSHLKQEDA